MPALSSDDFAGTRATLNNEGTLIVECPHGPEVFERVCNLATAAVKQGCVGVVVTERGKARKWCRAQLDVDGKRLRIETDPRVRTGGAQSRL